MKLLCLISQGFASDDNQVLDDIREAFKEMKDEMKRMSDEISELKIVVESDAIKTNERFERLEGNNDTSKTFPRKFQCVNVYC